MQAQRSPSARIAIVSGVGEEIRLRGAKSFHNAEFGYSTYVAQQCARQPSIGSLERHGCATSEIEIRAPTLFTREQGVDFCTPWGRFLYPSGYIFRPLIYVDPSRAGSRELAAEQTVYDGSYPFLNVQFFLLAAPERCLSKRLVKVSRGV